MTGSESRQITLMLTRCPDMKVVFQGRFCSIISRLPYSWSVYRFLATRDAPLRSLKRIASKTRNASHESTVRKWMGMIRPAASSRVKNSSGMGLSRREDCVVLIATTSRYICRFWNTINFTKPNSCSPSFRARSKPSGIIVRQLCASARISSWPRCRRVLFNKEMLAQ